MTFGYWPEYQCSNGKTRLLLAAETLGLPSRVLYLLNTEYRARALAVATSGDQGLKGGEMPNQGGGRVGVGGGGGVGPPFQQHLPDGPESPEGTMTGESGSEKHPEVDQRPPELHSQRVRMRGWLGPRPGRRLRCQSCTFHSHKVVCLVPEEGHSQSLLRGTSGSGRCSRHTTLTGSVAWSSSRRPPRSPVWLYRCRAGWSTVMGMLKFRCG